MLSDIAPEKLDQLQAQLGSDWDTALAYYQNPRLQTQYYTSMNPTDPENPVNYTFSQPETQALTPENTQALIASGDIPDIQTLAALSNNYIPTPMVPEEYYSWLGNQTSNIQALDPYWNPNPEEG